MIHLVRGRTWGKLQRLALFGAMHTQRPKGWWYVSEMELAVSALPGSIYPLLAELERHGLLESRWADPVGFEKPRRVYRLVQGALSA